MGLFKAPSSKTAITSVPLSPAFDPRASPSLSASMFMAMTMFTTNFIRAPAPTSPRKKVFLPITSKHGWASSFSDSSPAVRMTSCPLMAGTFEPLTGASTKRPPLALMAAPMSLEVSSSTVDMSTNFLPGEMPANTPCSPKTTLRADSGSDVHAKTMSHFSMTSCAVSATLAPFLASSSQRDFVLFHKVTSKPASMRRFAIAEPMMPMPKYPIVGFDML
mmetsp:Transcript_41638/g.89386  ORF Transcript_41638/g.89386 Transcript_41638/m.89386 type:complete len:219 (+) Transcript_41638:377-1033(+)